MSFVLLDLFSQARAVERATAGLPLEQKLDWLRARGTVTPSSFPGSSPVYHFESRLGSFHTFMFDADELVFIGDHTTYRAAP